MSATKTIAAIATAPGRGGIGIVRISGPLTKTIAQTLLGSIPQPRYASYADFKDSDNSTIDQGLALYFPAPNSFTGEDVLELHGHGGPVILDALLQRVIGLGAELAKPGEFSERAFLNNKLDLAQAEAIADLIDASSLQAARAAVRSLQGEFSKQINILTEQLIRLRVYVEAAIDFPEEEIDFLSDGKIKTDLEKLLDHLNHIQTIAQQGSLLRDGMTVVIAGPPNAGKSSLLNALSGRDVAIVTDIAGTTRDVLREHIQINGIPLHIVDTAGLRASHDPVEQIGIARAREQMTQADHVLLVVDSQHTSEELVKTLKSLWSDVPHHCPVTIIYNKIDLVHRMSEKQLLSGCADDLGLLELLKAMALEKVPATVIKLSAKTQEGLNLLREHLQNTIGTQVRESTFSARRRHLVALDNAYQAILRGQQQLEINRAGELLAEELRLAQQVLNTITGEFTSDDLLGEIFSSFCIGK